MKQKCIVLIDGSNFYYKLKDLALHNLLKFNFTSFIQFLSASHQIIYSCYYIGKIRQDGTSKTNKLFNSQQQLIGALKNHHIKYCFGYLLKSDGIYHEKGVDVQIAVDMLVAAYEDQCDRIILVSSDTDLAPAIKKAQQKGKIVEYVGFSHKPSVAMVSFCNESRILAKADILPFIESSPNS